MDTCSVAVLTMVTVVVAFVVVVFVAVVMLWSCGLVLMIIYLCVSLSCSACSRPKTVVETHIQTHTNRQDDIAPCRVSVNS